MKNLTEDDIEAKEVAKEDLEKLPKLYDLMESDISVKFKATKFWIQIMYKEDSGPWHGNIIVGCDYNGKTLYVNLNHWHKGIGLIDVSKHPALWGVGSAIRCSGFTRKGLTLRDVVIYGLKWWASVDLVFSKKYYSKQLWPASCHGLADTVAFHIAKDYSKCMSVNEWWSAYKKERLKRAENKFSFRSSRRKSRRKSRLKSRRKSRRKSHSKSGRKSRSKSRKSRRKSRKSRRQRSL